jgi:type IV pilus assembly protein PilE
MLMTMRAKRSGFTLIELVVTVAIIAILAAIAIPSYENYLMRARRADGREMLQRVAAAQERFYTNRNTYTDDLTTAAGLNLGTAVSEAGHYTIAIAVPAGGQSYTLTATPQGIQADDDCNNLTVNNVGARGYSGSTSNGSCW